MFKRNFWVRTAFALPVLLAVLLLGGCENPTSDDPSPQPEVMPFTGYFKGDAIPWDDGIGATDTHFYQYDDGGLGVSFAGEFVKHIPDTTASNPAGIVIIRITDGGSWVKTEGNYYAIAYKNYGYSESMGVTRIQTSSAYKGGEEADNSVATLAEAITTYTIDNGYFGRFGNYRKFREEVPEADDSLTLTGLEGPWIGADEDDADYFIRIANPVLTWSSAMASDMISGNLDTAVHQFAGTIVEIAPSSTDAGASGYIYFKVDFVNTKSGDYDDLVVGNYYAIHWKDKTEGSIKLCAAYGDNTAGETSLAGAKSTYTVENDYFDPDYYVDAALPSED
jgi:hypothetical protein